MSEIFYGLMLDIRDNTTDNNIDFGLVSGVFYWITGRPGYAGSGYSGEAPAAKTWKQGIITGADRFSPVTRMAKGIEQTGGYGSMSGFDCEIDNAGDFISTIETAGYYIINRPAKLYVFIDDVSYQIWTGKLAGYNYDGLVCNLRFEDTFRNQHKPFPPDSLTKTTFPNIDDKNDGDPIPVCLGDVLLAELKNVEGDSDPITIAYTDSKARTVALAKIATSATKKITLWTPGREFTGGALAGLFLRVVHGGTDAVYAIEDNQPTDISGGSADSTTQITLLTWFDSEPTVVATRVDNYNKDAWGFSIYNLENALILSMKEVEEIIPVNGGLAQIKYYNQNAEKYIDVGEIGQRASSVAIGNYPYPGIDVINNIRGGDGAVIATFTIEPLSVKMSANAIIPIKGTPVSSTLLGTEDHPLLHDRDGDTGYQYVIESVLSGTQIIDFIVNWEIEIGNLEEYDLENLYVVPKFTMEADNAPFAWYVYMGFAEYSYLGVYSSDVVGITPVYTNGNKTFPAATETDFDMIPTAHFNSYLRDTSEFETYNAGLDLQNDFVDTKRLSGNRIKVSMRFYFPVCDNATRLTVNFKEFAIVGKKSISLTAETFYTKLRGEYGVVSAATNNVYGAVDHILKNYDGITSSEISYGNLYYYRSSWHLGRQIVDRKNSFELLDDLAKKAFFGIFPTRKGLRGFQCFREQSVIVAAHDRSIIKAGSIKPFKLTDVYDTYNDFKINYQWDPGRQKYTKSLYVTKAAEPAFPAIYESTGTDTVKVFNWARVNNQAGQPVPMVYINFASDPTSWALVGEYITIIGADGFTVEFAKIIESGYVGGVGYLYAEFENKHGLTHMQTCTSGTLYHNENPVQKWKTYVGGISDHATAGDLWAICRANYVITQTVNRMPDELSNIDWYIDRGEFEDGYGEADNSAYKYLCLCVDWLCRQKYITSYLVPVTAATVVVELYKLITLSDVVYTGGNARSGYVNSLKLNPDKNEIEIELILIPTDLEEYNLIIETGDADDTYTESGSQADTVTEGVQ